MRGTYLQLAAGLAVGLVAGLNAAAQLVFCRILRRGVPPLWKGAQLSASPAVLHSSTRCICSCIPKSDDIRSIFFFVRFRWYIRREKSVTLPHRPAVTLPASVMQLLKVRPKQNLGAIVGHFARDAESRNTANSALVLPWLKIARWGCFSRPWQTYRTLSCRNQ